MVDLLYEPKIFQPNVWEPKADNGPESQQEADRKGGIAPLGEVRVNGAEESPTHGTEVFVDLEGFVVEGSESTDTAEATAEHEPDVAQRGEGGGYVGPDSFVTSRAVLGLWRLGQWYSKLKVNIQVLHKHNSRVGVCLIC